MFTIDLLNGEGVPIKSRPEGIAIAAATFTVPTIIVIVLFSYFIINRVDISVAKHGIINYEKMTADLSDAVQLKVSFEKQRDDITKGISEVFSSLDRHIQWTPVIITVVENMPDSMVLTELQVREKTVRKTVPKQDDPQQSVDIIVILRTLSMSITGNSKGNYDSAVRDFRNNLLSSDLLGPKLEDIRVTKENELLRGADTVFYTIDCIFKTDL